MLVIICKTDKYLLTLDNVMFFKKYDRHPVTFELRVILAQEGRNVPLK